MRKNNIIFRKKYIEKAEECGIINSALGNRRGLKIWNCIKRKKLRHLAEAFFFRNIDKASRKHYNDFAAGKLAWIED